MFESLRRRARTTTAVVAAGAMAAVVMSAPALAAPAPEDTEVDLTVLGTTDLHGHIKNWDYYKDAEYDDADGNDVGLAKVSTLVNEVRDDRGADQTLLVDAGDTIQGTPLANYFANVEPITETNAIHPMAAAMNAMHYDAAALGNHEFNYGLPILRKFESQLDFPLLSANTIGAETGEPAFSPYVIKDVQLKSGETIQVGILGLTTPGVAIWDKQNVQGKLEFPGIVEQAKVFVPEMIDEKGADVVIVSAHSGTSGTSSYGDELPLENASTQLAEQVPGIDAILVGHAHDEIPERFVTNTETQEEVLLTEPLMWGMRLSVMDFSLEQVGEDWQVTAKSSAVLNANTVEEDPEISGLIAEQHQTVVDYVNQKIGVATETMPAEASRYRDTAVMDFVNHVQTSAVQDALAGTENADLPVLSIAAPFNREAVIPEGPVTIRDMASLYVFPNTLYAVEMTGQQIKEYLEYSAKYFNGLAPGEVVNVGELTNANDTPDYNYDMFSGISYEIELTNPVGERIINLTFNKEPIKPEQRFAVATNNYRQSGGGNFPYISEAPVLVNEQQEIRQLLVDYAVEEETIDPADFFVESWWLTLDGERLFPGETVAPDPGEEPTPGPGAGDGDEAPGRNPGLNVDTAAGDTAQGVLVQGGVLSGLAAVLALAALLAMWSRRKA